LHRRHLVLLRKMMRIFSSPSAALSPAPVLRLFLPEDTGCVLVTWVLAQNDFSLRLKKPNAGTRREKVTLARAGC
jgi:hypothetical protein